MLNYRGLFIIFLVFTASFLTLLAYLHHLFPLLFFPQLFFCIKTFVSAIIKEDSHFCNLSGWLL